MKKEALFASDNNSGIHPEILAAIENANLAHHISYGADSYTRNFQKSIKREFGKKAEGFLVFNGTGANVLSFSLGLQTYNSLIVSDLSHAYQNECGAPERALGCRLISLPVSIKNAEGKITLELLEASYVGMGDPHRTQPKMVSITQATELGTVYRFEEVRAIADWCHARGMFLHMDGARISNAAVFLGSSFKRATVDLGVDVLSLGGTKNGLMGAEAVVVFNPKLLEGIEYHRKQLLQLSSKMRFIAAQFIAFFEGGLWKINAAHANAMASLLADEFASIPGITISRPVETNSVFALLDLEWATRIQKRSFFYFWNAQGKTVEARFMASFDTKPSDVKKLLQVIKQTAKRFKNERDD